MHVQALTKKKVGSSGWRNSRIACSGQPRWERERVGLLFQQVLLSYILIRGLISFKWVLIFQRVLISFVWIDWLEGETWRINHTRKAKPVSIRKGLYIRIVLEGDASLFYASICQIIQSVLVDLTHTRYGFRLFTFCMLHSLNVLCQPVFHGFNWLSWIERENESLILWGSLQHGLDCLVTDCPHLLEGLYHGWYTVRGQVSEAQKEDTNRQ